MSGLTLAMLESILGKSYPIPIAVWAAAHIIGEARRLSNEDRRASRQDRGATQNTLNDLMGAFGEIWLYSLINTELGIKHDSMLTHMLNPDGGGSVEGADLHVLGDDGSTIGIDLKTIDRDPKHRLFAINAEKHFKLGGDCGYYIALAACPNGRWGSVSQLIPYSEVEQWNVYHTPGKPQPSFLRPEVNIIDKNGFNDAARGIALRALASQCGLNLYQTREEYNISHLGRCIATSDLVNRMINLFPKSESLIKKSVSTLKQKWQIKC